MFDTCAAAVRRLMKSSSAISGLLFPSAISRSTSTSRTDKRLVTVDGGTCRAESQVVCARERRDLALETNEAVRVRD